MASALEPVMRSFEERLRDHLPSPEAGVRETLAQACREVLELGASGVQVEAPWAGKWLDIRVVQPSAVIELKYHRPIPSGRNRPMTMQFGQLLADVRKLATVADGSERLLVLVTDDSGMTHLRNKALLPVATGARQIRERDVLGLAKSASGPALADGPWVDVRVAILHRAQRIGPEGAYLLAWTVRKL